MTPGPRPVERPATEQSPKPPVTPQPERRVIESKMPPALWVRIVIYTVGCHLMAIFLYLLFLLGDKS